MKRAGIYFFYDRDGVVDDYAVYFLKTVKPFIPDIYAVVNGVLTEDGRIKLSSECCDVFVRDNTGLDATAYKYAIERIGYDKLAGYDEVLCFNFTCFGAFFDLRPMFDAMEQKQCDWWGLFVNTMKPPYVAGEHLPSFFVAYRRSMVVHPAFKEYWDTLPEIKTYNDSVMFHEERQTPYFDRAGFKRAAAFDFSKYDADTSGGYWPLTRADELVVKERFPFLKRRCLYVENGRFNFKLARNAVGFIRENTDYDVHMIYENIIRTQDVAALDETKPSAVKRLKWKILSVVEPRKSKRESYRRKLKAVCGVKEFAALFERAE